MIQLRNETACIRLNHEAIEALKKREAVLIGGRIQRIRLMYGIEIAELARQTGKSFDYISRIENGEITPEDDFLRQVCEVSGASYDWLTNGGGDVVTRDSTRRIGDLLLPLAGRASATDGETEFGHCMIDTPSAEERAIQVQHAYCQFFDKRYKIKEFQEAWEIADEHAMAQWEDGFERGMRYGARLVVQLLMGRDGAALDDMIVSMVDRLRREATASCPQDAVV